MTKPITDEQIKRATCAARRIKLCWQVGSYAWTVVSNRKLYHVQTDAEWLVYEDDLHFSFAVCSCDGPYQERTTACAHVVRVLIEIRGQYHDE